MVGKAKWAKGSALVALDHGRDGRIGCVGLGHSKEALDVSNLSDDISEVACIDGILGGNDGGDTALCTTEVNWKWGCVQGMKLSNLVSRVDNHFGLLNEGKTQDCVYSDVWANRNKESGGSTLAREVRPCLEAKKLSTQIELHTYSNVLSVVRLCFISGGIEQSAELRTCIPSLPPILPT